MCIAIYKPADKQLTKRAAKNSFENNRDGAGFAYVTDDGKIVIEKGFFRFRRFWKSFRIAQDKAALVHFRIKTEGSVCADNCHPFQVNNGLVMAHNGCLPVTVPKDDDRSDTRVFVEDWIRPRIEKWPDFLDDEVIRIMIEDFIGKGNKLVFLRNDGEYLIINESAGWWDEGIWYSNKSYSYVRSTLSKPLITSGLNSFGKACTSPLDDDDDDLFPETDETWWERWQKDHAFDGRKGEPAEEPAEWDDEDALDAFARIGEGEYSTGSPQERILALTSSVEATREEQKLPMPGHWDELRSNEEVWLEFIGEDYWQHSHFGVVTTEEVTLIHNEEEIAQFYENRVGAKFIL